MPICNNCKGRGVVLYPSPDDEERYQNQHGEIHPFASNPREVPCPRCKTAAWAFWMRVAIGVGVILGVGYFYV